MPTNKELLEDFIKDQREQSRRQLEIALETSNRLNKLEIFIYGDPLTETKGVVQDIRETKERLNKVESIYKINKTKITTALFVLGFLATGFWKFIKYVGSLLKGVSE